MAVRDSQLLLTPKVTQGLTPHRSKPQDLLQGTAAIQEKAETCSGGTPSLAGNRTQAVAVRVPNPDH